MPIKQLQDDRMGFVEAGRIRLGIKKTNKAGKEYPAEVSHFVLKDATDLLPAYGTEPRDILVYLPYKELDANFRVYMEEFRAGGLYCQGDGDRIIRLVDPGKTGEIVIREGVTIAPHEDEQMGGGVLRREMGEIAPCPGPERNLYSRCANCRPRAMLFVMVRDPQSPMEFVNRRLVYYTVTTGSMNNIREITRSLNTAVEIAKVMGIYNQHGIARMPLIMRRVPGMVSVADKNGQRIQTEKWFVRLEYDRAFHQAASNAIAGYARGLLGDGEQNPSAPATPPPFEAEEFVDAEYDEIAESAENEIEEKVLNLLALKDEVPPNFSWAQQIVSNVLGSAYVERAFFLELREALGIAPTTKLIFPTTEGKALWPAMVDTAIRWLRQEAP